VILVVSVPFLVLGLGDDSLDAACAEVPADGARRIRLVTAHRVGPSPRSPDIAADTQLRHQRQEHG
jgi:hypothetical protein